MRSRRALPTLFLILALAGCGGDDAKKETTGGNGKQQAEEGDPKGAETAVRDYLKALIAGDGASACDQLSPEYQKSVVDQNADIIRGNDSRDCPAVVAAIVKSAPRLTFEGNDLKGNGSVDKLDLKISVRISGKGQNATVTGAQGLQRYELEMRGEDWKIASITSAGG